MKRFSFLLMGCLLTWMSSWAWGRVGHAVVAQIAENNLTPAAKAKVKEIMHGESFVKYASFADDNKKTPFLTIDHGEGLTDGTPRYGDYPHTFEVDKDCKPFHGTIDKGRYVKNCLHFIEKMAAELETGKNLSDSAQWRNLVMIVHLLGDMHCPEHMRFNPDDMTIGYYKIRYKGNSLRYHTYWDREVVIDNFGEDVQKIAKDFDVWKADKIKAVVKGSPYDWGYDSAKCSEETHHIKEGDTLTQEWCEGAKALTQSQLTKAGYRLAELLNRVLK